MVRKKSLKSNNLIAILFVYMINVFGLTKTLNIFNFKCKTSFYYYTCTMFSVVRQHLKM